MNSQEKVPHISVLVASHNGEQYIAACLDSLNRQSLQFSEINAPHHA